jgi:twitching motility protein PilT
MPRADGLGRVAAVEVMTTTAFIRDCIIDKDKTSMISGAIAAGTSQYGMQTFDQAIFGLYSQGMVTLEESLRWASNVDDFKLKVAGISTTTDMARDDMAAKVGVVPQPGPAPSIKSAGKTVPTIDRFGKR